MTAVSSPAAVAFSGEPGSFAEDAVLAAFGEVPRRRRARLPGRLRGGDRGRGHGRRRADRERRRRHDPGDAGPAAGARPGHRRRGRRPRPALPGRAAGAGDRGHRAGLVARPGARAGERLPPLAAVDARLDVQHRRRRQGHRGAWGAGQRGGPLAACRGAVRAGDPGRGHRLGPREPDTVLARGAAGRVRAGRSGRGGWLPDDRGVRGPERARHAAGRAPLVRGSGRQPLQARVTTQPRNAPGSTCSGPTSTARSTTRPPRTPWPTCAPGRRSSASSAPTGAPRTRGPRTRVAGRRGPGTAGSAPPGRRPRSGRPRGCGTTCGSTG